MSENTEEKKLIKIEDNIGIFRRIRLFFKNLFGKKEIVKKTVVIPKQIDKENARNNFIENLKVDSDVEADSELLELQRKVRDGITKIEDLTEEQEDQLIDLYDKQIAVKKAKIEEIKKKIEALKKQAS
jgi:vacuolar-type H+-ATPase subunit I/STV1